MRSNPRFQRRARGFGLMEALVTLIILLLGLLGLVSLMLASQRAEAESYQRAQALILLQDMVERINGNRSAAGCYAVTIDPANGVPYLGIGAGALPPCSLGTVQAYTLANSDLAAWSGLLAGASELSGTSNVGAMVAPGDVSASTRYRTSMSYPWPGRARTRPPRRWPASRAARGCMEMKPSGAW